MVCSLMIFMMIPAGRAPATSAGLPASLAPVDGAEPLVAEQRVKNAERSPCLRQIGEAGIGRIAAVPQVLQRDRVLAIDGPRERYIGADDVVVSPPGRRGYLADKILASRQIE